MIIFSAPQFIHRLKLLCASTVTNPTRSDFSRLSDDVGYDPENIPSEQEAHLALRFSTLLLYNFC